MSTKSRKRGMKKSGGRKFFTGILVVVVLAALFMTSFWVTSLVLKFKNQPILPERGAQAEITATPKPTYEQLEKMVADRDAKISELEAELMRYKGEESLSSGSSSSIQEKHMPTPKPSATAAPTKTPQPTPAPTTAPPATQAPTVAPAVSIAPIAPNAQGN